MATIQEQASEYAAKYDADTLARTVEALQVVDPHGRELAACTLALHLAQPTEAPAE